MNAAMRNCRLIYAAFSLILFIATPGERQAFAAANSPQPISPMVLKMPFVSSSVGMNYLATRKVPKSNTPPLKVAVGKALDPNALIKPHALGHELPKTSTTASGRPRADFAIAPPQKLAPPQK
jgi:hypothetical protein